MIYELIKGLLYKKPPCIFRTVTGFYCPGCGGTRSLLALLRGDVIHSLWYHPFVLYFLISILAFAYRYVKVRVYEENTEKALLPNWVYYCGVVLVVINCVVKNVMKFNFDITLLSF